MLLFCEPFYIPLIKRGAKVESFISHGLDQKPQLFLPKTFRTGNRKSIKKTKLGYRIRNKVLKKICRPQFPLVLRFIHLIVWYLTFFGLFYTQILILVKCTVMTFFFSVVCFFRSKTSNTLVYIIIWLFDVTKLDTIHFKATLK